MPRYGRLHHLYVSQGVWLIVKVGGDGELDYLMISFVGLVANPFLDDEGPDDS